MLILAGCFGFVLLATVSMLWQGWVLVQLWSWFIIPVFNAPELSIAYALGISLVFSMFEQTPEAKEKDPDKSSTQVWLEAIAKVIIKPLLALVIGFIVHQFV